MNDLRWICLGIIVWLAISILGNIMPTFLGLIFFLFVAPIACGYCAGKSKKTISIVIVSITITVLAGIIYGWLFETMTGWRISWLAVFLCVGLNALLVPIIGYFVRARSYREEIEI